MQLVTEIITFDEYKLFMCAAHLHLQDSRTFLKFVFMHSLPERLKKLQNVLTAWRFFYHGFATAKERYGFGHLLSDILYIRNG